MVLYYRYLKFKSHEDDVLHNNINKIDNIKKLHELFHSANPDSIKYKNILKLCLSEYVSVNQQQMELDLLI